MKCKVSRNNPLSQGIDITRQVVEATLQSRKGHTSDEQTKNMQKSLKMSLLTIPVKVDYLICLTSMILRNLTTSSICFE